MKKLSLLQRVHRAIFKPKQVMIVDADSRKAAKNWSIRPITLTLIPLIFIIIGALAGSQYLPNKVASNILPQHIQLQNKFNDLHDQFASSEAENEVKQAQILSLEALIKKQQGSLNQANARLRGFESILEARKSRGTKILKASIKSINPTTFNFSITLVKGGNYPRRLRGSVYFITQDKHGKNIRLRFKNKQSTLPFRIETHIFLQGQLYWPENTAIPEHVDSIIAIVLDKKGKELTQEKCTFEDI